MNDRWEEEYDTFVAQERPKQLWVVCGLKTSHPVTAYGGKIVDLPLDWADGMVGVLPVFDTYEAAETYAGGKKLKYGIMMIQEVK